MTVLTGTLRAPHKPDFTGYRVTADYERAYQTGGQARLPASQSTAADADGRWRMTLDFQPCGEVRLTVRTAPGVEVGSRTADDFSRQLPIRITDAPSPVLIRPSRVPAYGRAVRLTGRALQPDGSGAPAGLPVVLWAKPDGGPPLPALVTGTTDSGYFSGEWPSGSFADAWSTVGGGEPIPVRLVNGRLPQVVLLVVPAQLEVQPLEQECECRTAPPPAPEAADLVANPQAFSQDQGQCVNLTTPNRTLEEVTFHAVVRTTEPEIKGTTLADPDVVPPPLASRLAVLAEAATSQEMSQASAQALRLDQGIVSDQLRGGHQDTTLRPSNLLQLQRLTDVKQVSHIIDVIGPYLTPGRVTLDSDHTVDWDDDPTIYQATSIAIGHLLTLKQVWRADGYSLGDLLYSLPLAPGQKKQIAIVDWERKEQAIRESRREETERLAAELAHDRDISDIMDSALSEHSRGRSSANVSAVGGGFGAFIGPLVLGGGGGHSEASSTAYSHNWRDVTATALNQARDRTQQAAATVRGQRSTTIQTATQGESVRAQTEVVANHNHCHALSMEYFEVLRHFKVSTELADARECLFVPFELSPFTPNKALRWWEPLSRYLSRRDLAGGFDALERIRSGWDNADVPLGRYADEQLSYLDGTLTMTFNLPRPADDSNDGYVPGNWSAWAPLMPNSDSNKIDKVWNDYLGNTLPKHRDQVWNERLAPQAAEKLVDSLYLNLKGDGTLSIAVPLDATLVSRFRQDAVLQVSLDLDLSSVTVPRSAIKAVEIGLAAAVPYTAKVVARSGSLYYRTDHLAHQLYDGYRIDHDLSAGKHATIGVHLDRDEKRNPRKQDALLGARLVAHLNERLEFYHQAIWRSMHPNRRYLLLDGIIAPNSGGRSVASVVENRLIGIVGNCLVLPVVPGRYLDPGYQPGKEPSATLLDLYAVDAPPPFRISVATKGVFAEAVLGACNSCEEKDDNRFWRWEESPIPEEAPPISPVSTGSRRSAPPDLRPDEFPDPIIGYQQVPNSPDPTGLAAALKLIGTPNVFRDLTGLDLNQQAAAAAFSKALETAQFFGTQAGNLAQQRYANREMDRNLGRVKKAVDDKLITPEQGRTLTEQFLRSGSGKGASTKPAPSSTPAVQKAIDRAARSESGSVKVSRPSGSVEVNTGGNGPIDFDVTPAVAPIKQPTPNVCWAAGGAMLMSWKERRSLSIQAAGDAAGPGWRAKLDADQSLRVADIKAYTHAIGMTGESPMCYLPRGLLQLLKDHGPLWVVGDDAVANNQVAHVLVVTGMHGDGTSDGTEVYFADPGDGAVNHESYTTFSAHLEAADPASLNLGIYHY